MDPEQNPYAYTGASDGPLIEDSPPAALDLDISQAGRKLGMWLLIAGGAQLITEALVLTRDGGLEALDWLLGALIALVPATEIYTGVKLRTFAQGPETLAELSDGINWLRWTYVLKVLGLCAAAALLAFELWTVLTMMREGVGEL